MPTWKSKVAMGLIWITPILFIIVGLSFSPAALAPLEDVEATSYFIAGALLLGLMSLVTYFLLVKRSTKIFWILLVLSGLSVLAEIASLPQKLMSSTGSLYILLNFADLLLPASVAVLLWLDRKEYLGASNMVTSESKSAAP